eukprot:1191916-Prorocentrum_minimum.AAC.5
MHWRNRTIPELKRWFFTLHEGSSDPDVNTAYLSRAPWALSGRWEGISARAEKAAADRGEIDQKMPLPVEKVLRALRQKGALKQWIKEHCTE